jgi:uncharacterized protein YndB with AHSA1/START domain
MKTLKFSVHIAAPREIVWNTLWNEDSYRKWTSIFRDGTYAISDWKEGSKILFMTPSGEGINSVITRKIPNERMSFRHMGMIRDENGKFSTEEANEVSGSLENYFLHEEEGITELKVEIDAPDESVKYFESTFPLALRKIKELAEVPQHHKIF